MLPRSDSAEAEIEVVPPPPGAPVRPAPSVVTDRHDRAPPARVALLHGSRRVQLAVILSLFIMAGLSDLTGAPPVLSYALAAIGGVALALWAWALNAAHRAETAMRREAARSREELESLADRMWELQESEERFRGLIDALGDIVVHRDRKGRIVYANRVLADLVGMEPRDLAGRTLGEIGIDVGTVPDAAFSNGECLSSTDVAIRSAAGERWFSWIELSVRDKDSNAVSHRAIAREITARKRAETALIGARERAEHASQAKSRFLATVSHEIRTPMNGIMGMAKLLADTRLSPEQQTYVGAISTSASALLALIEDLLDYSKIEVGRLDLEPQPVALREMAENVVELLASRAHAKEIGLACFVDPAVPAVIEADPGRLRQVLLNLIGNAVKFTDRGGVLVTIGPSSLGGTAAVRIAVRDTGPGLGREDMDRIFHEFEQADTSSTRRHGGAGLGLAISKRILDAMHGTIDVASEPGAGAEFVVTVPARPMGGGAATVKNPLRGRAVLVVTDNAVEAEAIALAVRAHGGDCVVHQPGGSPPGPEALSRFDTVIVDAHAESRHAGLLDGLRAQGLEAERAVTLLAPAERGRLPEFRRLGYGTFLVRPVRGETLLRALLTDMTQAPGERLPARGGPAGRKRAAGLSVLLAEDNEINAMLAKAALGKAGHRIEVVTNGRAAVDAVTDGGPARRFDVLLMDLHMPEMDGLDAISAIRRHEDERGTPPVPILVLSADGQEKTRHLVLAHGATGFLAKPLDPAALVGAVEEQAA